LAANGTAPMVGHRFVGMARSYARLCLAVGFSVGAALGREWNRANGRALLPVPGFPASSWLDSVAFLSGCPESWAEIGKFRIPLNLIRLRPA